MISKPSIVALVLCISSLISSSAIGAPLPVPPAFPATDLLPRCERLDDLGCVRLELCGAHPTVMLTARGTGYGDARITGAGTGSFEVEGDGRVTAEDQRAIREIRERLQSSDVETGALLRLLGDFVTPGERLRSAPTGAKLELAATGSVPWSDICDQVGQKRTMSIEMNGVVRTKTYIVGSPAQGCPGRCGPVCDGPPVYTEECLVHDACVDMFGDMLAAECAGPLFAAVQGFVAQQTCSAEQMSALDPPRRAPRGQQPGRVATTPAPAPVRVPESTKSEIDF